MIQVKTIDKIAQIGLCQMDTSKYNISSEQAAPQAILLRSTSMHEMELPESLLAVARAGAGTNNIPIDKCTQKGIVVFNTPGANAMAVTELVMAALLLTSRRIIDGVNWAQSLSGDDVAKQVEKGKSAFAGPEIGGKTLGVIGLGAIGKLVANMASSLGMNVIGHDPSLTVESALKLPQKMTLASSVNELYKNCDYITLHVPLNDSTNNMINDAVLAIVKKGVRLLNFSRAELVDPQAIIKAAENGTVSCYVTDFPTEHILNKKNIIPIPHLGASTPESEDNCACMAVKQVMDYLETGSIVNSVNFPVCPLSKPSDKRVAILHQNVPNILAQITAVFEQAGVNMDEMVSKNRNDIAYTVIDTKQVPETIVTKLKGLSEVISVRII